jgi:hypothetical protein
MGEGLKRVSPWERRFALAGLGAVAALTLGGSAASLVRLPADVNAAPATDQTLALAELPSEAAARANALNNPPLSPQRTAAADDVASGPVADEDASASGGASLDPPAEAQTDRGEKSQSHADTSSSAANPDADSE